MTYKIWYKEHQMFDIEIYIKESIHEKYITEIKPCLLSEGIAYYVNEQIKTKEDLDVFLTWCDMIECLRLTLFEGYPSMSENWENMPTTCHEADKRLCKVHLPVFIDRIKDFCAKFGLDMSED